MDPPLLFALRDTMHTLMGRLTSVAGAEGLTMQHMFALRHIDASPGIQPTQLASTLNMTPGSLTPIVQRLVASGFVERRPDPNDRRAHHLHVAPRGQQLKAEIEEHMAGIVEGALADWSDDDRVAFRKGLERLQQGLSRTLDIGA